MRRIYLHLFFLLLLNPTVVFSQVLFPGNIQNDIFRMISLEHDFEDKPIVLTPGILTSYNLDSLTFIGWERLLFNMKRDESNFSVIDPSASISYNSEYARGMNDGAVWQGRGLNTALNFGFSGNYGKIHYTFSPVIYYAQNRAYRIDSGPFDKNQYQYPFGNNIDWVLRYGDNALADFWWGQSEVRFIHKNATVGFSTQNFIWGPSVINPILMSNNASGFPHLDIGTATPARTKIGDIEFRGYWGVLRESDYFDDNPDNDHRFFTGWTLGYRPSFLKGISIGISRLLYRNSKDDGGLGLKDIFASYSPDIIEKRNPIIQGGQNDLYDQIASLTVRWALPREGLEFYLEYAKNDFPGALSVLFESPDRSRGFNIGVIKVSDLKNGAKLLFNYEHTTLANNQTRQVTIAPSYYIHSVVDQGYTNNGQIMGASVGPGANADFLRVNYYHKKHILGFNYHRNRHNDDYVVGSLGFNPPFDAEHSLDFSYARKMNNLFIDAHFNITGRKNWYYDDDVLTFFNLQPSLRVTYMLP